MTLLAKFRGQWVPETAVIGLLKNHVTLRRSRGTISNLIYSDSPWSSNPTDQVSWSLDVGNNVFWGMPYAMP